MQAVSVHADAEEFVRQHAGSDGQLRLLTTALRGRKAEIDLHGAVPEQIDCVYVPWWVYAAVRRDGASARPLATAAYLLWTGIDLLDALMDGDPLPEWQGFRSAEISLAGMTLVSAMAPLALSKLDAPPATIVAMNQTLNQGLLRMSAGQQEDVATAGADQTTVAGVIASVAGKTGEGLAMLAALAAQLAGATEEEVALYSEMGHALGVARQLQFDCYDLFVDDDSKDLVSGTRTLPIAWHLQTIASEQRASFLALLDQARADVRAREAVRAHLRETDALRMSALVIEMHCERARGALARVHAHGPATQALHRRINDASIVGSQSDNQEGEPRHG